MSRRIRLRSVAEHDLAAASEWYLNESQLSAARFEIEVIATFESIGRNPLMFPRVHGEIRRAMTRRFPYAIYFIVDDHAVNVLRVLHQARDPRESSRDLR